MPVKAKIRLDFKAETGGRRFFWQRRDLREVAKALRARQVSLLRSLPFQGLSVEKFDVDQDIYIVPDGETQEDTAYAPVEMIVEADSIEDLMQFTLREEFRKIKVLEPEKIFFSSADMERFLFKVNEGYRDVISVQE